jgi:hypothetical protein
MDTCAPEGCRSHAPDHTTQAKNTKRLVRAFFLVDENMEREDAGRAARAKSRWQEQAP